MSHERKTVLLHPDGTLTVITTTNHGKGEFTSARSKMDEKYFAGDGVPYDIAKRLALTAYTIRLCKWGEWEHRISPKEFMSLLGHRTRFESDSDTSVSDSGHASRTEYIANPVE